MLRSNALILGTIFFACSGIFAMFYGIFMTQIKLGDTSQYNFLTKDNSPWFKPKVKVLMVIVDALRFDYLLEYENIEHLERLKLNKFKKFNKAFYANPEQFVVLRAFADPPTWTVLRVPIMMTGNIPQKVHIMTSFGPLSAMEDSIPRQVQLGGKKTYFAGDPTLKEFFSEYLISGTKTKGFDIRDDQVDDAPHEYILQKVADNDFDMMIAHILMVDHTGHLHNILSQNELDAIDNADQFIVDLINSIDDDTMLIFAGDHGMTVDGNHGGSLPQETNTAIVAYHKKGFMKNNVNSELKKVMRSVNETEAQNHQVDLVPTLAMLMGLPIPFSNMGMMLNDLYPTGGNYLEKEQSCPDAAFAMQMLKDNQLNSLQILNYFYKYQKQNQVGTKEEMDRIKGLEQEMNAAYKAAQDMIDASKQCASNFNGVAVNAILKSKKLAYEIYDFVNTKVPYDMGTFFQGFGLLILVAISYILLVQYLYEIDDRHLTWPRAEHLKGIARSITAVLILIALICAIMIISDARMHPITVTNFVFGLWIFGSLVFSFLAQNKDFSMKSLFFFQTPGITAGAVAIIVYLFYLIHVYNVDREKIDKRHNLNPYVMIILASLRICGRYINFSSYIMGVAGVICTGVYFVVDIQSFWSEKTNTLMGLLLLADWVWRECQFAQNNFKMSNIKIWSYQYFASLSVLAIYHLISKRETNLVQIYLPRNLWVILIGSCLISLFCKMPSQVIKRNMQVYLVLFMALLQAPKRILYFAMVLSAMRVANFLFKRVSFKNYLYPIVICFIGYMGLFMTGFTDRTFPASFTQAFVGLRDFNIVFSVLFYALAMMGTIILGMLFISYQDQDLVLKEMKLLASEEELLLESSPLKDHSEVMRKRSIILYGFFYNVIMISASIKIIVYRERHLSSEGVMEKFFVDAAFYLVVMIALYCML